MLELNRTRLNKKEGVLDLQKKSGFESVWPRIKGKRNKKNTVVGIYYRLLRQDEEENETFLCHMIQLSRKHDLVTMGDFSYVQIVIGLRNSYPLSQTISFVKREKRKQSDLYHG